MSYVKTCQNCGRPFEWRKKWEKDWENVIYCSKRCRSDRDKSQLKSKILELLQNRTGTICPSEVLPPDLKKNKDEMEQVRMAARLLVHEGKIEITQKNKVVDPGKFKGPIRLKLKK